jgi:hypothetical protein
MPWTIIVVLPFIIVITWSSNINKVPECALWEEIEIAESQTKTKFKICKEWLPAE